MNSSAGTLVEGQQAEGPALEARDLQKSYTAGDGSELRILRGVELQVEKGEVVAVIGASGVGKSTLLHLLGALDRATGGDVLLGGMPLTSMDSLRRAEVRNRYVGFVFQFHHLLREFSALENVALPRRIAGRSREDALKRADQLLDAVGLGERKNHLSTQLSGGEQQRVAVARALAMAAVRETFEETGIPRDSAFIQLDTVDPIPVTVFNVGDLWGNDVYVIPQYCFGVLAEDRDLLLSHEHSEFRWLSKCKIILHLPL